MLSTATRLIPAEIETPADHAIDQASLHLTKAFERLEVALKRPRLAPVQDAQLSERLAQLEKSLAILKEENEKLNHLLRGATEKYEQLQKVVTTVASGLDDSIGKLDEILQ